MRLAQYHWQPGGSWPAPSPDDPTAAQLLLLFYAAGLEDSAALGDIRARFPNALAFGCSTAGEIRDTRVSDGAIVATAVEFAGARIEHAVLPLNAAPESRALGEQLARAIPHAGLVHTLVLSDGLHINGSDLVEGLKAQLPAGVTTSGGLAGDHGRFERTTVICGGAPAADQVAILGFYGSGLTVGCGSQGGWDSFGPERIVTRSAGNVVHELDGQPALELYKRYLGEHAAGLPASALLFPLSVRLPDGEVVVRTILGVDEREQSMTFAGAVPQGCSARLMMTNFDRLVDGAVRAARACQFEDSAPPAELALLVSCVGRKLVLGQRIEEEVEGVRATVGPAATLTGFYSYGEISPSGHLLDCQLHNQTMTVLTLSEAA